MSGTWSQVLGAADNAGKVLGGIVELVEGIIALVTKAQEGDAEAIADLKRVDTILTKRSPTATAFERARAIAADKPPRATPEPEDTP